MKISKEELFAAGFKHAGTVVPDPVSILRINWHPDVPSGNVVYLMIVKGEVKKAGKAEDTRASTFKARMHGEFGAVRQVIAGPIPGRPLPQWRLRPLDPFKKYAPRAILEGHEIEWWAKSLPTRQSMLDEEIGLNEKYRGEWTKEGWTRDGRRHPAWVL